MPGCFGVFSLQNGEALTPRTSSDIKRNAAREVVKVIS